VAPEVNADGSEADTAELKLASEVRPCSDVEMLIVCVQSRRRSGSNAWTRKLSATITGTMRPMK